jgi:hypothetical protein
MVAREGIEGRRYIAESTDIFGQPEKVTLKSDQKKVWLLVDIGGR